MKEEPKPFIASDALASGRLTRDALRRHHRAVMPNVHLDKRIEASYRHRIVAANLWSGGEAIISGLSASVLHGAKWIDDDSPVELIWSNARAPKGVITRKAMVLDGEVQRLDGLVVTTPARTAFDIGRRGRLDDAIAHLDALARATRLKVPAVEELAALHRRTRGLRQLEEALDLVDPGAESPRETWLRLLLIRDGYPKPRTQIPVLSPDGMRRYYLDMGWENIMLAVEYEGDHHRTTRELYAYEIARADDLRELGWLVIRVAARNHPADVLHRVRRAWDSLTH